MAIFWGRDVSETGRIWFRSTGSNTELSEFFGPHRVSGRELSDFLSAYNLCAKESSPSSSQNSPSLPQNSLSSLFPKSTLEIVFRPFPKEKFVVVECPWSAVQWQRWQPYLGQCHLTVYIQGESEILPTSGPTSPPTRAPTRAPTRLDFPVFSPLRTPHESSHETSHEGVSTEGPTTTIALGHKLWMYPCNFAAAHIPTELSLFCQHFYFSHGPSPLLRGRRLSRFWRGSVLSRFSVGLWSVLVIFDRNWPNIDQESTQSWPLARCSIRACCLWGVTVCGWHKSVDSSACDFSTTLSKACPVDLPPLVAQCSTTPATVAATPPCSATPFQTQISVRHLPAHGGGRCDTKIFRGCSAIPVLHLQDTIKSRKSAATRVAWHV